MKLTLVLIATILLSACQSPSGVLQLSPVEFKSSLEKARKGEYIIIDVRTPEEFRQGHLAGAVNMDYYNADFSHQMLQLDKKQTLYIYCRSGNRSGNAIHDLRAQGNTSPIIELKGGISAWEDAQLDVVK